MHTQTIPDTRYLQALTPIWSNLLKAPQPGSQAETAMLERVNSLFGNYTYENLSENLTKVYAERTYFGTPLSNSIVLKPSAYTCSTG